MLSSTFVNPDTDNIQARSELERRGEYVERLKALVSQHPDLIQLVERCLHNVPNRRPSTEQLLTGLQEMRRKIEGECGGGMIKLDLAKAKLAKEVTMKNRRIAHLMEQRVSIAVTI